MSLTFNAENHTYALDGQPVPSVSKVIEPLYDFRFVSPEALERARKRGTAIHKTIELFELGRLNRATLHPALEACLGRWIDFKQTMNYVPRRLEQQVFSKKFGYAGTYDGDGTMQGDEMLLDVKSGEVYEPHKVQTAAYKIAAVEQGFVTENCLRGSIYISEDSWEFQFHKIEGDRAAFLSLLTILKWRENNGRNRR